MLFYFVLVENSEKRCNINGGRTRTRTLDPLIKSKILSAVTTRHCLTCGVTDLMIYLVLLHFL